LIHMNKNMKYKSLPPQSVAGGATVTLEIDTLECAYLTICLQTGTIGANGVGTIKLQESDVSGSGQVDIASSAMTALVTSTNNNEIDVWGVNLRGQRKRYITVTATNGATNASLLGILAILSLRHQVTTDVTSRGIIQEVLIN